MKKYNKLDNILKYYKDNKPQLIQDYKNYIVDILISNERNIVKTPSPFEKFVIYKYRVNTYTDLNTIDKPILHLQHWLEVRIYSTIDKIMEQRNFIDRTEHTLLEEILLEYNNYEII